MSVRNLSARTTRTISREDTMSLRQIAKQLGVSPAYLSYMVNGKRPWRPDLKAGYDELVNTSVPGVNIGSPVHTPLSAQAQEAVSAPIIRLPMAGARGSRTHRPDRRVGANGFEVRKAHQDPSAPAFYEGYLTRFVNNINKPLLDISKSDITTVLLGYRLLQTALEHGLRHRADNLVDGAAAAKDQQGRYAPDSVRRRDFGVGINV